VTITVQDDGVGFDPGREKGLGLLGIAERIERVDGLLTIQSKPGHGTIVSIRFPAPRARAVAV
jgi:signal transduction histidine kinase